MEKGSINRRKFLTGASAAGISSFLTGCSGGFAGEGGSTSSSGAVNGSSNNSLKGTTITHLQYSSAQSRANKAVKEQFKEETGITVQIEAVPFGDLLSKTLTLLQGNSSNYAVIDADMGLLPTFAAMGGLQPLDEMVADSSVISPDLFPKKIWKDAAIYGPPENYNPKTANKTFINQIPYQTNVFQGYHRTDLYSSAGLKPPDTITEYIDVGKKLTNPDKGIHGMAMMAAQHDSIIDEWKSEYYATGRGFFEGETVDPKADIQGFSQSWKPVFNNEQAIKSLKKYVERANADYTPNGVTSWDWTNVTRNFVQGKLATAQAFSSTARTANNKQKSRIAGKVGYHIYPGIGANYPGIKSASELPNSPINRAPHYGSWCLAIPKNTRKQEAAWKWIEFLNKKDVQIERTKYGAQPCQKRVYEYLTKPKNSTFPSSPQFYENIYKGITEWGVGRPKIIGYAEWRDMMVKWLNRAAIKQISPEKALQKAEEETKQILSKNMKGYGMY